MTAGKDFTLDIDMAANAEGVNKAVRSVNADILKIKRSVEDTMDANVRLSQRVKNEIAQAAKQMSMLAAQAKALENSLAVGRVNQQRAWDRSTVAASNWTCNGFVPVT